jgi:hypothetical protein
MLFYNCRELLVVAIITIIAIIVIIAITAISYKIKEGSEGRREEERE